MILCIYGAGGLGREVLSLAKEINKHERRWDNYYFIDDFSTEEKKEIYDVEVVKFDYTLSFPSSAVEYVIAVGEPNARCILRDRIEKSNRNLATLVHPSAFVDERTQISAGVVVSRGCSLSCEVVVGTNTFLQPYAFASHDTKIGNDSVISGFVALAGKCTIGDRTYLGQSVSVREQISIGDDTIIGMGACVLRDIEDNVIAIGFPARAWKKNDEKKVFKK